MSNKLLTEIDALTYCGLSTSGGTKKLITTTSVKDHCLISSNNEQNRMISDANGLYIGCYWCFSSDHAHGQYQEGTVYSVSMQFWSNYGGTGTNFGTLSYVCGTNGGLPTTYNTNSLFFIDGNAGRNGIGSITSQVSIYKGYNQLETVYNTVSGVSLYPTPGCVFYFTINTSVDPSSSEYGYLSSSIGKETPAAAKTYLINQMPSVNSNYIIK